jgi:hypothetical protein
LGLCNYSLYIYSNYICIYIYTYIYWLCTFIYIYIYILYMYIDMRGSKNAGYPKYVWWKTRW